MLHSSATVIQRYFRGFMTRLRTVDSIRKLQASCLQQRPCQQHRLCCSSHVMMRQATRRQLAFAIYQDLVTEYLQTEFLPDIIM
jgi:hypothetical protein